MPVLFQRLWVQLTADRKRFGVLCGALAVALLLWARVIVVSNVPRTAVADEEAARVAAAASATVRMVPVLPERGRGVQTVAGERQAVVLDRTPMRDPFVISTRHFPRPPIENQSPQQLDKSEAERAEDSAQARAHQLAVLAELARRFKLEAVLQAGDVSGEGVGMAVINGRPWRQGDVIPAVGIEEMGFVLVEVKHRSVVLSYEEHLFELSMDR